MIDSMQAVALVVVSLSVGFTVGAVWAGREFWKIVASQEDLVETQERVIAWWKSEAERKVRS